MKSKTYRLAVACGLAALAMAVLAGYVLMVLDAPDLLLPDAATSSTPAQAPMTRAEQMTATHNARLLAISFGGALVVLVGLLYTARNYRLSHRGQVTDRFTKALERLGSDELYVRIGGIHALEHVLRDSADHHAHIIEVLVAFIRNRAPRAQEDIDSPIYPRPTPPAKPDADVQAALTALAHRPHRPQRERSRIDLADLHLQRADLAGALLEGADMARSRLENAYLSGTRLDRANLSGARLEYASLFNARLERANLVGARLEHANLPGARLEYANLFNARLERANLVGARLEHANLVGAALERATLAEARLDGANLSGARLYGANMSGVIVDQVSVLRDADLSKVIADQDGGWWPKEWEFDEVTGTLLKGTGSETPEAIDAPPGSAPRGPGPSTSGAGDTAAGTHPSAALTPPSAPQVRPAGTPPASPPTG